ncbi:hypothetical protein acsn021_00870 [Anaerocolumna cellulosilytica]|uniref:Uncharacterized protein n=1 Tax=Anaerocolumna cellulosilytica TaxID=433286 RepID=A0A6S6R0K6_9FIRM|nr:hypothetical protein [Anaerocolumna cellulosilytica]MBB5196162.1 hypothetical protein [Anaerocolumna cellulosilytica]BCJ92518.1 hypothetical protein acsn021_00870 [Anaerocolumna cellulosilytica]
MRKKRKFIVPILIIALFFTIITNPSTAFASTDNIKSITDQTLEYDEIVQYLNENALTETVVTNEVDYIRNLMSYSQDELIKYGFTVDEANEIINYNYNEKLIEFVENNKGNLDIMGYSPSEVNRLESYDGTEDALEYIETYALGATLTVEWAPWLINTTNQFRILYTTTWSAQPIFNYSDIIAIGFVGYNSSSIPIGMKYDETPSCNVQTYRSSVYLGTKSYSPDTVSNNSVSFKFPMSMVNAEYSKITSGSVRVSTVSNSSNLYRMSISFGYGHTVIGIGSPSVDISVTGINVSIAFSYTTETTYRKLRVYTYNGTLVSEV